jgi:hypothetical protein
MLLLLQQKDRTFFPSTGFSPSQACFRSQKRRESKILTHLMIAKHRKCASIVFSAIEFSFQYHPWRFAKLRLQLSLAKSLSFPATGSPHHVLMDRIPLKIIWKLSLIEVF